MNDYTTFRVVDCFFVVVGILLLLVLFFNVVFVFVLFVFPGFFLLSFLVSCPRNLIKNLVINWYF